MGCQAKDFYIADGAEARSKDKTKIGDRPEKFLKQRELLGQ